MIELENVTKRYGKRTVIDGLSLKIEEGERVALVAPSGGGKTTLFRLIAGLEKPDSGSVRVGAPISYVFQEPRLFPRVTALDNIRAVLSGKEKETKKRAEEMLSLVGLGGEGDKRTEELSGGMAMRVSLARALAVDRPLLLLDEPFQGLDREAKASLYRLIDEACRGKTLLLITHDPFDAEALSCRQILFDAGMRPKAG